MVWIYGISTTVGYLMPNPLNRNILNIYIFGLVGFYGISTIVDYLIPYPLHTNILSPWLAADEARVPHVLSHIVWWKFGLVGFYGISTIVGYLMPNTLHTNILNIYDLIGLGFMAYQPL